MVDTKMGEREIEQKVGQLMETMDQVARYNELSRSLKGFAAVVMGSVLGGVLLLFISSLLPSSTLASVEVLVSVLSLSTPVIGVVGGVVYIRRRVDSVKPGEGQPARSQGFPGAVRVLSELDWDRVFEEITVGRLSYSLYVLLKVGAYWAVTFLALEVSEGIVFVHILHTSPPIDWFVWAALSLLVIAMAFGNDLVRRYKELHLLDLLLWELRWFSIEVGGIEFRE